jgi:hypothetical protein
MTKQVEKSFKNRQKIFNNYTSITPFFHKKQVKNQISFLINTLFCTFAPNLEASKSILHAKVNGFSEFHTTIRKE